MFKFLKEKLKNVISKTSDKIEKEGITIEAEVPIEPEEKKGFLEKVKEKFAKKEKIEETKKEEVKPLEKEEKEEKEYEEAIKEIEKEGGKKKEEILEKEEQIIEEEKKVIEEEKEIEKEAKEIEKERPSSVVEVEEALKEEEEKELEKQRIEQESKFEELEIEKKKGIFERVKEKLITKKISYNQFEEIFYDLEIILLENNVAIEVIDKIKSDLKNQLVEKPIRRNKIEYTVKESLKNSITDLFTVDEINLLRQIKRKIEKPFIITFLGINGSGKTTTIAKIADLLNKNNINCVLAASDTFRAASIEQLQKHADNLGVKLIKHDYGSDPAAVSFDAVKHAKAKNIDVVLIDTAGRMHSNVNLVDELKKIIKVAQPDLKIFVGEAITGNDCTEQAKTFNEAIGIDGIILAKADIDEKGGAAISVSYVTKKPIIYLGTGQEYSDLQLFEPNIVVESLGLSV